MSHHLLHLWPLLFTLFVSRLDFHGATKVTDPSCSNKTIIDKCLDELPLPELTGIPTSREAVNVSCRAFKHGMSCIDDYAHKCLHDNQRKHLYRHVAGAKEAFAFLCDDPKFQEDYLRHKNCYPGISDNWDKCARRFMEIVREENSRNVSRTTKIRAQCCAKHGFLRCVYEASHLKCDKAAALFLKSLAETLSNIRVHLAECKGVTASVCTSSATKQTRTIDLSVASLLACLVLIIAYVY